MSKRGLGLDFIVDIEIDRLGVALRGAYGSSTKMPRGLDLFTLYESRVAMWTSGTTETAYVAEISVMSEESDGLARLESSDEDAEFEVDPDYARQILRCARVILDSQTKFPSWTAPNIIVVVFQSVLGVQPCLFRREDVGRFESVDSLALLREGWDRFESLYDRFEQHIGDRGEWID